MATLNHVSNRRIGARETDIESYLVLCLRFDEKPRYSYGNVDPYSVHARILWLRYALEYHIFRSRPTVELPLW